MRFFFHPLADAEFNEAIRYFMSNLNLASA